MNIPLAYRPLWNEYMTIWKVVKSTENVFALTEKEFVNACMMHSHGAMNPDRAKKIYEQLMEEAGL